ncbi:MAG: tRNA(Ile)(2)-agmatinylcytidine synthase [Candidatus Methanomethyliaceae archaeon]|nr:tRNA(Ile)(2)-agmatinylcytidine synthase [Candidatus Methanomethyliaceae archaeon]MDW7971459.1 tRNA(Ile)(2)-agmatinylcytidine synthase [Nitrososphaerota archaeon]
MTLYHLGIDDTDSLKFGCTTYVAALLIEELIKYSKFIDYPNLIRLNPNIPWKSRGNGAVCLRFHSDMSEKEILDIAMNYVEEYRDHKDEKNQPGIVLLKGEVPKCVRDFGNRGLYEVLTLDEAIMLMERMGIHYRRINNGRGIIGALAAIGNLLDGDYTFELIVYRRRELWDEKRFVDLNSVINFDRENKPYTFNNIDYEEERLLITPHGSDPVLFGVRGESPHIVRMALDYIKFRGGERWVVYRTNQGTDAHLIRKYTINELKPYHAVVIEGRVSKKPTIISGGHVIFSISDGTGEIDVAAYEPTGDLRMIVIRLMPGDRVRIGGGVRLLDNGKITLNLERLEVLNLLKEISVNPICPKCNKSMKSEGKNKGYQCKKCGRKTRERMVIKIKREISEGIYLPPARSMRHLTKPIQRYGLEKNGWNEEVGEFYGILLNT